jgi:hypothetical protein
MISSGYSKAIYLLELICLLFVVLQTLDSLRLDFLGDLEKFLGKCQKVHGTLKNFTQNLDLAKFS